MTHYQDIRADGGPRFAIKKEGRVDINSYGHVTISEFHIFGTLGDLRKEIVRRITLAALQLQNDGA